MFLVSLLEWTIFKGRMGEINGHFIFIPYVDAHLIESFLKDHLSKKDNYGIISNKDRFYDLKNGIILQDLIFFICFILFTNVNKGNNSPSNIEIIVKIECTRKFVHKRSTSFI